MRKVKIHKAGQWSIVYDQTHFMQPLSEGYYAEAFTVLDCFIDNTLDDIVVAIFDKHKEQDLFHNLKKTFRFKGKLLAEFLTKIGAVPSELKGKISEFKDARNSITHVLSGEFELVFREKEYYNKYKTQEEVEKEVNNRLNKYFNEGREAYDELRQILRKIAEEGGDKFHEMLSEKRIKEASVNKT